MRLAMMLTNTNSTVVIQAPAMQTGGVDVHHNTSCTVIADSKDIRASTKVEHNLPQHVQKIQALVRRQYQGIKEMVLHHLVNQPSNERRALYIQRLHQTSLSAQDSSRSRPRAPARGDCSFVQLPRPLEQQTAACSRVR